MKKTLNVAGLVVLGAAQAALAAFNVPIESPKMASMGGASMAASNEAASLFTNPAGISGLKTGQASFMYSKLFAGLPVDNMSVGYIALALPTRLGSFGLGWGTFMASGLTQEQTLALTFSHGLFSNRVQFGVTGKHLSHSFSPGGDALAEQDPIFKNGTSKSALGLDLGLSAQVMGPLQFGLAVRNVNRPNVGIATEDRLSREVQVGLGVEMGGIGLKGTSDLVMRDNSGSGIKEQNRVLPTFGLEKTVVRDTLVFRMGANPMEFTGGMGFKMGRWGFDYGLVINRGLVSDNAGTHKASMTFDFGGNTQYKHSRIIRRQAQQEEDEGAMQPLYLGLP